MKLLNGTFKGIFLNSFCDKLVSCIDFFTYDIQTYNGKIEIDKMELSNIKLYIEIYKFAKKI